MTAVDIAKCVEAITQTGYILESEVTSTLQERQWSVLTNRYYLDDVTAIPREVDLLAYKAKSIEKLTIYTALIISCKKSDQNSWVLLTRNLDKHDKNLELFPVDLWTNSKVMVHQGLRRHLLRQIERRVASDTYIKKLFDIERNVFAFQEVNLSSGTPQNDKRIYDSISTCIKAMEYEKAALKSRSRSAALYQFITVNVVQSKLIEYFCQDTPPVVSEAKHLKYLNRFIVNRSDAFHIVHFIIPGNLSDFLQAMDDYHSWTISQCQLLYDDYKTKIPSDHELRNLFAEEISKDILPSVYWKVRYDLQQEYSLPEKISIWSDKSRNGIVIEAGITDENVLQKLNNDGRITAVVAKSLSDRASYDGPFRFGLPEFEDEIPF